MNYPENMNRRLMLKAQFAHKISPVQATFLGSLLLSLVALVNNPTINRDGILYVETARIFLQDGFIAATKSFNWPFLSVLMALVSKLTGIGLEKTGHLLNALFMAGAGALVVASTKRRFPQASWSICLVVLALPGLNGYRDELLREYGCWFFTMLAFWLALRWDETPYWRTALIVQASLATAALFRPEALAYFPVLVIWQLFSGPKGEKWHRVLMLGGLPMFALIALIVLLLGGQLDAGNRLVGELSRIDTTRFDAKAMALSDALIPYAKDQAKTILFMGSLAIIPLKLLKQLGIFIVPLFFLLKCNGLRASLSRAPLFAWALLAHLFVLSAFVIDLQFLAGRYVAVLGMFAAPFIGLGLAQLTQRYPRWRKAVLFFSFLVMLSNVVSLTPRETYQIQAGRWLAENWHYSARTYVEGTRAAYYAGWTINRIGEPENRQHLSEALQQGRYDHVVLEVSHRDSDIDSWLENNNLRVVKRLKSARKDSVIFAVSELNP
jgi:hypothetical protein